MMRRYICTLLFLLSALLCFSKATVTMTATDVAPGQKVTVSLFVTADEPLYGGEFKIDIPEGLSYVEGSFKPTIQLHGSQLLRPSYSKGTLSVIAFCTDLSPLPDVEGALFTFDLIGGALPSVSVIQPHVVFSDIDGDPCAVDVRGVTIKVLAPALEVSREEIPFGRVPIRSVYQESFTISNTGTAPLKVSQLVSSSDAFSFDHAAFDLAPGENRQIDLVFSPLQRGNLQDSITIVSNAAVGPSVIHISGSTYSVNELHVQDVSCYAGNEVEISLTLNNMEPISVVQCSFVLPPELQYVKGSLLLSERAQGLQQIESFTDGRLKISLYTISGTTCIAEGEGKLTSFKIKVNGASGIYPLQPESVVLGSAALENMVSAVQGGVVTLYSPSLSCEEVFHMDPASVKTSTIQTLVLKNDGSSRLTISDVTFADEGYAIGEKLPLFILPGRSLNLPVKHEGGVPGAFATTMQIYCDDPVNSVRTIQLDGSFYEPNELLLLKSFSDDGDTCVVTVGMENYSEIAGVQMTINGLADMMSAASDIRLSTRCSTLHPIVSKKEDGTFEVILYSLDNRPIEGHGGVLFEMTFHKEGGSSLKSRVVTLSDIILSNQVGVNMASSVLASTTRHLVNLNLLSGNDIMDKTRIVFNNEKSVHFESICDAQKLHPESVSSETCYFYSRDDSGVIYSINERLIGDGVVPLSIVSYRSRILSISADRMDCSVILHDKLLNVKHPLSDGPYLFSIEKGITSDRFELILPAKIIILGDANGDGVVTIADIASIVAYLNELPTNAFDAINADMNKDGVIDMKDVEKVRSYILK